MTRLFTARSGAVHIMAWRIVLLATLLAGCVHRTVLLDRDGRRFPRPINLRQAHRALDRILDDAERAKIVDGTMELHFGLGHYVRNNMGLWSKSLLWRWFKRRGVTHPEYISGIILGTYHSRLLGKPLELDARLASAAATERQMVEEARAYEAEGPNRAARLARARAGWRYDDREVPLLTLPEDGGWTGVVKLERHRGGFLLFTSASARPLDQVWHSGVHYLEGPLVSLRPAARAGCDVIHDAVTIGEQTHWLCRTADEWLLLHDDESPAERLPFAPGFLRLGTRGDHLFVHDHLSIHVRDGDGWAPLYRHPDGKRGMRLLPLGHRKEETFTLPRNADTPRMLGRYVYFSGLTMDHESDVVRLDIGVPSTTFDDWSELFVGPYFGRWGMEAINLVPGADGQLWVTTGRRHAYSLFELREDSVRLPIIVGSVAPKIVFSEGLLDLPDEDAPDAARRIPARAVYVDGDALYLAGHEGIAAARGGRITPIVRFAPPPRRYGEYEVTRVGRFADGSFVMTSPQYGAYVLLHQPGGGYEVKLLKIRTSD